MNGDDWRRTRAVLDRLLDLPEAEREAELRWVAESDPAILGEVASFLAYSDGRQDAATPPMHRIGDYALLRQIGGGGTSIVYAARKDGSETVVALKLVVTASGPGEREQTALALLRHRNIVPLLDRGVTDGGFPFLVLPFIDGAPLDDYCKRHCGTPAEICRIFAEVCDAVAAAHAIGIAHRDLKPANILVDGGGTPHLLDFGGAKLPPGGRTTAPMAMTLAYASPEQVRGESAGAASDVYSLGVLLFELLADRLPYESGGEDLLAAAEAICSCEPDWPRLYLSAGAAVPVSAGLVDILRRCLEKDAAKRYANAAELGEAIRRWLAAPGQADQFWWMRGTWRGRVGSKAVYAAIAVLLLAAAAPMFPKRDGGTEKKTMHRESTERLVRAILAEADMAELTPPRLRPQAAPLVQEALLSLRRLEGAGDGAGLAYEIALAHELVGRAPAGGTEAVEAGLEAQRRYFQLHQARPEEPRYRIAIARNYLSMASAFEARKDRGGAFAALREARRYASSLASVAGAEPLANEIERREAKHSLVHSRLHLAGTVGQPSRHRAAHFLGLAEAELRNGLLLEAERHCETGQRLLAEGSEGGRVALRINAKRIASMDLPDRVIWLKALALRFAVGDPWAESAD